ncbi:MAG: Mov34/MPN/PAD-1 family protein [Thaumarchaeota archaeon]|nr:Mov34/MPN/PAD-1 family protein [Nitrososphaerota archaeon]
MIFKQKKVERQVSLKKDALDGIISYCKMKHPNECILILKGKSKNRHIVIDSLVIPPFSDTGPTFAGFPSSFLPLDLSYVGIVHSHPTGSAEPSLEDLNNFFGLVSLIVKSPYEDEDVFAWDRDGNPVKLTII